MKPKNVEFIEEFIEILGGDNFFPMRPDRSRPTIYHAR